MGSWRINPRQLHMVLVDVAADGQSLDKAAGDAAAAGEQAASLFGSAADVAEAFAGFWSPRSEVGQRIAGLVYGKSRVVAETAELFVDADGQMSAAAVDFAESLNAGDAPVLAARGFGPVPQP
ncbi:hypothetical protein ACMX2H_09640 [Arthrobacter sulfonylureivorans]|uniref:hypothetical protein n=1 Tax=Arthrobacter sulfonylureivorans TaxID=2486855 RepID=UPI0039E52892